MDLAVQLTFWALVLLFIGVGAVLEYHWKKYSLAGSSHRRMRLLYGVVSAMFLGLLAALFFIIP